MLINFHIKHYRSFHYPLVCFLRTDIQRYTGCCLSSVVCCVQSAAECRS